MSGCKSHELRNAAPIFPEDGMRASGERMQQHTHVTWFRRSTPELLTLFAQQARTTATDAHYRCI
ncbi:hypothetical protein Krac_7452 [Ktedonobacter racemifer DSM 44963]|uniref:Uncharacterized protein n=1 Tax=Ktedonobacter racemifer DSM 44963 TaxID=485913 RepID=D6TK67_KTERA|nr:hypothetical protein Krac_7452 [Ktedonobacter racemifer DSM 44963]